MSSLLEVLGRGLLGRLDGAFGLILGAASEETIEDLKRCVAELPDDLDARVRLGGKYLRADDAIAARRLFTQVLAIDKACLGARVGLACALDDLGRVDQALEELRVAQKADPVSPAILFCLGYCHERSGRATEAVRYY